MAREVLSQLKEHGRVTRGLLGVLIQRVDNDMAKVLSLPSPDGALVSDVLKATPAFIAGFKRRDVIVSFNGQPVKEHDELPLMVARTPVGSTVPVEVIRDGKKTTLKVTITELKDEMQPKRPELEKADPLGLIVETVSEELAHALGINPPSGVTIVRVEPNSLADKAGLLRGDVIEEFDGQYFKSGADWRDYVKREFSTPVAAERLYLALVRRREGARYVLVKRLPGATQKANQEAPVEAE
jgi:serine protease Do